MLNLQNVVKGQYEQNCSLSLICQEGRRMKNDHDMVILEYSKDEEPDSMLYK